MRTTVSLDDYLKEQLQDPQFRAEYETWDDDIIIEPLNTPKEKCDGYYKKEIGIIKTSKGEIVAEVSMIWDVDYERRTE